MNMRTLEDQAAYDAFKQTYEGACAFCDMPQREPSQVVETNDTIMVIQNIFPYVEWDGFKVSDHRMVVPKRHMGDLEGFSQKEQDDYFDLLRKYEMLHYSFYQRAPSNTARTVYHLHTHLIKPVGY